jgi:uncharacterized protein (TIGR02145 family)
MKKIIGISLAVLFGIIAILLIVSALTPPKRKVIPKILLEKISGNKLLTNDSTTLFDKDGNVYNTVTIGTQTWMTQKLKTTKYNNGTDIPLVTDSTVWNSLTTPSYSWYDNDFTNKDTYLGALYNWYAASSGKLCPTGWHVPTDAEWTTLIDYLGGSKVAGGKLKGTGTIYWMGSNKGSTNDYGFTALPGGDRGGKRGSFCSIGYYGCWWSSTEKSSTNAWYRMMHFASNHVSRKNFPKNFGYSIRCLKD